MAEMVFLFFSVFSEDQKCDQRAEENDTGDTSENNPGNGRDLEGS